MPSNTQHLRALIRQTTLRTSATTLQRTSYPVTQHFHNQPPPRSRSPSPPPPYTSRGLTLHAPTGQWTRFTNAPYNTLSSIRTFTRTSACAATPTATPAFPPDVQARIDEVIENITDMYGTAKDEFEIASEESEKNSTYAPDDRAAAREELDKLVEYYRGVVGEEGVGEEVRRRVGGRIRELEEGVKRMEEEALHEH
jgi:hypothetical protein